jgi:hypothetical protein
MTKQQLADGRASRGGGRTLGGAQQTIGGGDEMMGTVGMLVGRLVEGGRGCGVDKPHMYPFWESVAVQTAGSFSLFLFLFLFLILS